jgi:hypothetical protein
VKRALLSELDSQSGRFSTRCKLKEPLRGISDCSGGWWIPSCGSLDLLPALRRQAAWKDSEIVNIDIMLKSTGVNTLFERDEQ